MFVPPFVVSAIPVLVYGHTHTVEVGGTVRGRLPFPAPPSGECKQFCGFFV